VKMKNITTLRKSIVYSVCAFLLWSFGVNLSAQDVKPHQDRNCFTIHVHLNQKPIEGPHTITLKTKAAERVLSLEGNCFRAPQAILAEPDVDVLFTVPGSKIHLYAISTTFLSDSWDIDLEDKKFSSDVLLPKHAHAKEACNVIFHGGEPENVIAQTGCRTPVR